MDLGPALDHVVLSVPDLDEAIGRFQGFGFTVLPGGIHDEAPTHNALIGFQDGTYIELIAFLDGENLTDPGDSPARRLAEPWRTAPYGLVDFALYPNDIEADIARCNAAGVPYAGPILGGRVRPDGRPVRWCLGIPSTRTLPFLCGDITPRQYRIPMGASAVHDNGIQGIAEVTVAAADPSAMVPLYETVLGDTAAPDPRGGFRLTMGSSTLHLIETRGERDPGICSLTLWGSNPATEGLLPSAEVYGAHIVLLCRASAD